MQSVVKEGTAERLSRTYDLSNDIAGKTGTTQSQADGWFMGYTPNLVVGAWVGGITPAVRFRSIDLGQGANMALPICAIFLKKLYSTPQFAALKSEKFPQPAKWIIDSMDCAAKIYYDDENSEDDIISDSLNQLAPDLLNPNAESIDPNSNENHDLRDGHEGGNPAGKSRKPEQSDDALPSVKPEVKSDLKKTPPRLLPPPKNGNINNQ
jgi:membrane carboxypeptidase/penicillin-binding protein